MQWACEACTLVNEAVSQACQACGTPANGPAASGLHIRGPDNLHIRGPDHGQWSSDEEEEEFEDMPFSEEEEVTSDMPAELAEGFKRIQEEQDQQAAQELRDRLERYKILTFKI